MLNKQKINALSQMPFLVALNLFGFLFEFIFEFPFMIAFFLGTWKTQGKRQHNHSR